MVTKTFLELRAGMTLRARESAARLANATLAEMPQNEARQVLDGGPARAGGELLDSANKNVEVDLAALKKASETVDKFFSSSGC